MSDASLHELLSAWMDGQLTGSEKVRAEQLISENPECADLVRQWKSQRDQIRALPRYRLDHDFSERVLANANLATVTGRVSRPRSTTAKPAIVPESTSYFATRSALTAITALAAMLLLTLFTLPTRSTNEVAMNTASSKPHRENDDPGRVGIVAAKDEAFDDSARMPMKAGDSDVARGDSRTNRAPNEIAAPESVVETDQERELESFSDGRRARGVTAVPLKPGATKSLDETAPDRSQKIADSTTIEGDVSDGLTKKQIAGLGPTIGKGMDLPAPADAISEENQPETGAPKGSLADQAMRVVPGTDPANPPALSLFAQKDGSAKVDAGEFFRDSQLLMNSVDEVWMVEIEEVPSIKKLEQAMRENEIAFKKPPAQFGRHTTGAVLGGNDANVQAIYAMTSPTQLRGAIRMLARNAEINEFPLPTISAMEQVPSNQVVDQDQPEQDLNEEKALFKGPNSFAQQLPSSFHGAGESAAGVQQTGEKSELQRRYLLMLRFDPATASKAEAAPAEPAK